MYASGDSSGDGLNSLNQFGNVSGTVDWAAMAQQWIQMHDTSNFTSIPEAPPPPNISKSFHEMNMPSSSNITLRPTSAAVKKTFDEKGEADMDMDEDEENARNGDTPPPPAPSMQLGRNREPAIMQSQAPWYMQPQNHVVAPPVVETLTGMGSNNGQITPAAPQWNATVWPPRINLPPPTTAPIVGISINTPIPNPTAHIPSLLKMNVPNPNAVRMLTPNVEDQNSTATMVDAKKRKMLPAWIREGLEKMEREKQKQQEREQSKKREEPSSSDASNFQGPVGSTVDATLTVNMKYTKSAEHERSGKKGALEDLDDEAIAGNRAVLPQSTRKEEDVGGSGGDDNGPEYETDNEANAESRVYKGKRSYDDRLSDLMIVVRTTLTELLLEVTNQEIANLSQEAVNAQKAKASSAQVIRKSALSSITGKLGLAAYDDSTGDEISDSDDAYSDNDANNDSEEEIKASIRAKRRAFAKVTDDIEERIAASAAREEQKLKYYTALEKQEEQDEQYNDVGAGDLGRSDKSLSTVSKSYERDFGEATETKLQHSNGKRQKDRNSRKERTTRFSDNKDSKGAAAVAASYISQMHNANSNLSGNTTGSALFPIAGMSSPSAVLTGTTIGLSSAIAVTPLESSYGGMANPSFGDDNSEVSALNKNLLNAAEAAFEKVTKRHRASNSRSLASGLERVRSHHSSRYDHRDCESSRYSKREREKKRERDRDRDKDRRPGSRSKQSDRHSSDADDGNADDNKSVSKSTSSDTETSSTSSTSTSSNSRHSSHYSRTSTTSKQRRECEYDRRERRDERNSERRRQSERSRSRSRHRSHNHQQRSRSNRHSSAEDDYDNDIRHRHSSSRHSSSRKRSRSRSRSTYSSSSHRRRH